MILADTSVWVSHLHRSDPVLAGLLSSGQVLGHPWVTGELLLGGVSAEVRDLYQSLEQATVVADHELHGLIEAALRGGGIGYVDAQLLAASRLAGARLWSYDRSLDDAARRAGLAWSSP